MSTVHCQHGLRGLPRLTNRLLQFYPLLGIELRCTELICYSPPCWIFGIGSRLVGDMI